MRREIATNGQTMLKIATARTVLCLDVTIGKLVMAVVESGVGHSETT